jgi:hypothetical protein
LVCPYIAKKIIKNKNGDTQMPLMFSKRHYPKDFTALIKSREAALIKKSERRELVTDAGRHKPTHGPSELVKLKPQLVFWNDPKDQEKPTRVQSEPGNLRGQRLLKHPTPNSRYQSLNLIRQKLQEHLTPNSRHQRLNLRGQKLQEHLVPNSRHQKLNLREQRLQEHLTPNSRYQSLNLRRQKPQEHLVPNSRHQKLNLREQRLQEHLVPNGRYQRLKLRTSNHRGSALVNAGSALLLAPHKVRYHYGELIPCQR